MIDSLKILFVGLLTQLAAYLNPISGNIKSLIAVFLLNFLFGLFAALLANKESFSFKKAFRCVIEAAALFVLISAIYYVGEHNGNASGALQCVSFIAYAVFYFYGVNIVRNIKTLAEPYGGAFYRLIAFLYYVISVEFIKQIPFLSNYQQAGKEAAK